MVNFSTKHKLGGCYPRIEASRERVSCAEVDIAVPWNLKCAKPPKFSRPGRVVEARIQGCEKKNVEKHVLDKFQGGYYPS